MAETKKLNTKPIPLEKAKGKTIDYVDGAKNYRAVIQLGPTRRWRKHGGGKWKRDESTVKTEPRTGAVKVDYNFEPAIHEVGVIPGDILNGLISLHNKWVENNTQRTPEGQMNRQLLVVDFHETTEIAPERVRVAGMDMRILESVVRVAVAEAMKQK